MLICHTIQCKIHCILFTCISSSNSRYEHRFCGRGVTQMLLYPQVKLKRFTNHKFSVLILIPFHCVILLLMCILLTHVGNSLSVNATNYTGSISDWFKLIAQLFFNYSMKELAYNFLSFWETATVIMLYFSASRKKKRS